MTLFNNSSPSHHRSTILENIRWTQTAYAILCQLHHTNTFYMFSYALIWTKTAYPCGAADTEQRTQFASSGCSPKWRYSEMRRRRIVEKRKKCCNFYFLCVQKVFLMLHNIQIEPLMTDGLLWRCLSYFYGPWQCNLLGSQWDSHKPPGFHPKYFKLCSEDEQSFYGFGTTWG